MSPLRFPRGVFLLLFPVLCSLSLAPALTIKLDYSLDKDGFFDNPARRAPIEEAARFLGDMIVDKMDAVDVDLFLDAPNPINTFWEFSIFDPISGEKLKTTRNLKIPKDTIIVYVFGSKMGEGPTSPAGRGGTPGIGLFGLQPWFDHVTARGQVGALSSDLTKRTDVSVKVGFCAINSQRKWNVDLNENKPGLELFSLAMHELLHVLGIGTSQPWKNQLRNQTFTGPNATLAFGKAVPVDQPNGQATHFREDNACGRFGTTGYDPDNARNILSRTVDTFGDDHGVRQISIMDPFFCDNGDHIPLVTALDVAALQDIGYEVALALNTFQPRDANGQVKKSDPGTVGFGYYTLPTYNYVLESSGGFTGFDPMETRSGTGGPQEFSTPTSGGGKKFYRVRSVPKIAVQHTAPVPQPVSKSAAPKPRYHYIEEQAPKCSGGHCHHHDVRHAH